MERIFQVEMRQFIACNIINMAFGRMGFFWKNIHTYFIWWWTWTLNENENGKRATKAKIIQSKNAYVQKYFRHPLTIYSTCVFLQYLLSRGNRVPSCFLFYVYRELNMAYEPWIQMRKRRSGEKETKNEKVKSNEMRRTHTKYPLVMVNG